MSKLSSFEKQFRGGYFPQEHWDESTAVNGNEPSGPTDDKRRLGISRTNPVHAFPGMVGKNDYDREPGKPKIEKNPGREVVNGGWDLQQNPERKLVPANTMTKEDTMSQGDGPKKIKSDRRP